MHYRTSDGQMDRTDFIGLLPQSWRFNHVFRKFENKIWKKSIQEKGIQLTWFSVQRVQKQQPLAKLGKITFISFCYHERVHCNKGFSHGNSKSCCESQIRAC